MNERRRRSVVRLLLGALGCAALGTSVAAERLPLALKGYDPVAYFTLGKAVRGLPQFEVEWDEQRYHFARPEHRQLFIADPARYAPQFANLCAMALTRGEIVEANPEYWLVSEGKLYIFGKPGGPALFAQDLQHNVVKAERNRPRAR